MADRLTLKMAEAINKMGEQAVVSELLLLRTEILALRQENLKMAKNWQDLKNELTESRTVQQRVLTVLGEIKQQLKDALAAADPTVQIEEAIAMIDDHDREMADAIATPAPEPTPTP